MIATAQHEAPLAAASRCKRLRLNTPQPLATEVPSSSDARAVVIRAVPSWPSASGGVSPHRAAAIIVSPRDANRERPAHMVMRAGASWMDAAAAEGRRRQHCG